MAIDYETLIDKVAQQPYRAKVGVLNVTNHRLKDLVDASERVDGAAVIKSAESVLHHIPGLRVFQMVPGAANE